MARLWSSGFELNSNTSNVEITTSSGTGSSISSTNPRSGTYLGRGLGTGNDANWYQPFQSDGTGHVYARAYIKIVSAIDAQAAILQIIQTSFSTVRGQIRLNADNTLELWNNSAQVGSDSSALNTDQWYRIELKINNTTASGSHEIEALIDGVSFASSSAQTIGNIGTVLFGLDELGSVTTGEVVHDDIAINDSSGSFQNSWPGEGEIIHLRPNAAGDNNELGTADSTNYQQVDEVTPDDLTTRIGTATDSVGEIDDYNLDATPAAMDSDDTINCVQVGVRFRGTAGSNLDDSIALRIKASSGGTVEESSDITPTSTSFVTNTPAAPRNYPLTLYDLPGASTTAWTKADLDTAQIGFKKTVDDSAGTDVSTIWLLVDHKPTAGGAVALRRYSLPTLSVG